MKKKTTVEESAPTYEELKAKVAELERRSADTPITFKIADKGGCSVYGLGRFPVTLYYEQWVRLLHNRALLEDFLAKNKDKMKLKGAA